MHADQDSGAGAGAGAGVGIGADPAWADRQVEKLRAWGKELGFSQIGIAGVDLHEAEPGLLAWLQAGFHGDMHYMAAHGLKRARPAELVPGTLSVITVRMDYLPAARSGDWQAVEWVGLRDAASAQVSMYARGRDYHKVLRARLQRLAERLQQDIGPFGYRAFTDSAPVLEVELARRSGLGWRGKHTLLLQQDAGSLFFLGELYTNLALPPTAPGEAHCGTCTACIDACPTGAIVAPERVDARRCVSYLTIEHAGAIAPDLRPAIGNRLYGCDDCQLACPWNKFAQRAVLADFDERPVWGDRNLLTLWSWTEADFLHHTEGSAIRRIGFERWQRNLAVVSGNALRSGQLNTMAAPLRERLSVVLASASPLVAEHLHWALQDA